MLQGFCEKIEFGHSIIAENMCRMHKCAKLKGCHVCDYYTVTEVVKIQKPVSDTYDCFSKRGQKSL